MFILDQESEIIYQEQLTFISSVTGVFRKDNILLKQINVKGCNLVWTYKQFSEKLKEAQYISLCNKVLWTLKKFCNVFK